jgi:hypothetical protein
VIRKAAGIEFPGWDPSTSWLIAEVEMDEEPELGMRREGGGIGPVNRMEGGGPFRVVLTEQHHEHTSEPTLQELRHALVVAYGTDFGVHSPTWISRFTDMTRQAASYREGRVLLASDAAHVHPPAGGQGLNTGVQADRVQLVDAVRVGMWELPVLGEVTGPTAVLIRPDGHVAWVGDLTDPGLPDALTHLVRSAYPGIARAPRVVAVGGSVAHVARSWPPRGRPRRAGSVERD